MMDIWATGDTEQDEAMKSMLERRDEDFEPYPYDAQRGFPEWMYDVDAADGSVAAEPGAWSSFSEGFRDSPDVQSSLIVILFDVFSASGPEGDPGDATNLLKGEKADEKWFEKLRARPLTRPGPPEKFRNAMASVYQSTT